MMKLLLVEDHLMMRKLIKDIVIKNFETEAIYEVDNGAQALKIANENGLNLIIVDIGLPDINGLEVIKRIRQNPANYNTPVIFITADPTKELEAYRNTHCHSYLTKPIREENLVNIINHLNASRSVTETVEKKLMLKFRTHNQWIFEKDIYYAEYINRKIRIYFSDAYIDYKSMPLKDFYGLLSDGFVQIHQSIIINRSKIKTIDFSSKTVYLYNQPQALPIGRNYINKVRELQ